MILRRSSQSLLSVQVLSVSASRNSIVFPEQSSFSKNWQQMLNDLLECPRVYSVSNVEAVNISLPHPSFQFVSNMLCRTDNGSSKTANLDVVGDSVLGPFRNTRRTL